MPEQPRPTGAVFLSYASQDAEAAKRIAEALRAAGVEVWFDQSELVGGDAWDAKIRKQIADCALFVPVISANTQARREGYFRLEWRIAAQRTHMMSEQVAFLLPAVVDGTSDSAADIPAEFKLIQWTRLPAGETSPVFCARVRSLLEGGSGSRETAPAASTAPASRELGPSRKAVISGWAWGGAAAVLVAVGVGVVKLRQPEPPAASATKSLSPSLSPSPPPQADDKSVAVLAFANLSDDKSNEYFSDGISEELLNVLAKVSGLKVSARTSAFHFKGKDTPIPEIARQLGVAYVVEGSVRKAGDKVRITAQLIKAADGFHVWSDTFDRDLKDIFAVQDEIAGLIAQTLALKLGTGSVASAGTGNPEVLRLYLDARRAWNLRTHEGAERATELLNQALAIEPGFARAHAALADVIQVSVYYTESNAWTYGWLNSPTYNRMLSEARRAIALDPNSAEAHAALGGVYSEWQPDEAIPAFLRAIELNPNYATAHQWLSDAYFSDGQVDKALAAIARAAELDPLSHRIHDIYSRALNFTGRAQEALAEAERALALQPDSAQAMGAKSFALLALGRIEEGTRLAMAVAKADPGYASPVMICLHGAGRMTEVRELIRMIGDRGNETYRFNLKLVLGPLDEALAIENVGALSSPADLLYNPFYDRFRADPRFLKLLATVGLGEGHARAQAWRKAHPPEKAEGRKP